jgi:hypothetical protein
LNQVDIFPGCKGEASSRANLSCLMSIFCLNFPCSILHVIVTNHVSCIIPFTSTF